MTLLSVARTQNCHSHSYQGSTDLSQMDFKCTSKKILFVIWKLNCMWEITHSQVCISSVQSSWMLKQEFLNSLIPQTLKPNECQNCYWYKINPVYCSNLFLSYRIVRKKTTTLLVLTGSFIMTPCVFIMSQSWHVMRQPHHKALKSSRR